VNIRPARQLWLPFEIKGGLFTSKADTASLVGDEQLMEKVVERGNLLTALGNVKRNGGSSLSRLRIAAIYVISSNLIIL
jgi:hypothetical protein